MAGEDDAFVERERRKLLGAFAGQMAEFNTVALNNYNAALGNFETTTTAAGPRDASAHVLKLVVKTAAEEAFKLAAKAMLDTAAPVATIGLALANNLEKEFARAAAAAASLEIAAWVRILRTSANDAFAKFGTEAAILGGVNHDYEACQTEEDKVALVEAAQYTGDSIRQAFEGAGAAEAATDWSVPSVTTFECGLYEGWINSHFTAIGSIGDDISGFIDVRIGGDGGLASVELVSPLGDRIGNAIDAAERTRPFSSLMELGVHKRVCKIAPDAVGADTWQCGWFDDINRLIHEPNSEAVTNVLLQEDWRADMRHFVNG